MTGIPGLSELPGFQMPLNGDLQNSSTQLVVMVTPHIIRMPRAMFAGPRVAIGPVASN
jgi:Flp pilus assembly secretin CpaC